MAQTIKHTENIAEPGTVIHGTHRPEHIIPVLMSLLFKLDKERAREIWQQEPELLEALCSEQAGIPSDYWQTDDCMFFLNEELFDIMEDYAPAGYYFGAHIGDGSDFGYWQDEDTEEDI